MEDTQTKLDLFHDILRIRRIEEAIGDRYSEQKMRCPMHLSIGQEGIAVGVCKALMEEDRLISHHRCHAHYLAKGGNLNTMIAELHGKKTGCSFGRAGSMHLVDLSVRMYGASAIAGNTIPIGVGLALADLMKGNPYLTVIFLGDGATEEGTFAESLNFASLKQLPVLFVCENNLYSINTPISARQSKDRDRVKIAQANGLLAFQAKGNMVQDVYQLAQQAVSHIRQHKGPVYLEFETYRFRSHTGPKDDTHLGYRSEEELNQWKTLCPLKIYQDLLMKEGIINAETLASMEEQIHREIDNAFSFAEESPYPEFDLDYEKPYAESHS